VSSGSLSDEPTGDVSAQSQRSLEKRLVFPSTVVSYGTADGRKGHFLTGTDQLKIGTKDSGSWCSLEEMQVA
jgi:hypothetical protein